MSGQPFHCEAQLPDETEPPLIVLDGFLVRKNIATNGRLFCVALAVIDLVIYLKTGNRGFAMLAVFAVAPVALAVVTDQIANPFHRQVLGYLSTFMPALVTLSTLLNLVIL